MRGRRKILSTSRHGGEALKMQTYSCCFTGHRIIPAHERKPLLEALRSTLRIFAAGGITEYICGGALGFDTLAAEEVLRLKTDFPHIRLTLVLPCRDQAARWTVKQKETYAAILDSADKIECLFESYVEGCMHMRNRFMVDHADVCVAYFSGKPGGTAYTVQYAREKGVKVVFVPAKEEYPWEI